MDNFFIERFAVNNLWKRRSFNIPFDPKVNIIIGQNASGKTTVLNFLRYVFTGDFEQLSNIYFDDAKIILNNFKNNKPKTIRIKPSEEGFDVFIGRTKYEIASFLFKARNAARDHAFFFGHTKEKYFNDYQKALKLLLNLVPAVWLPVSRRLPVPLHEERLRRPEPDKSPRLESVDRRLHHLNNELVKYRHSLETKLSEQYRKFERSVFEIILYSKKRDNVKSVELTPLTAREENQLIYAFKTAGFLDKEMEERIHQHFSAGNDLVHKLSQHARKDITIALDDIFLLPLISRTKRLVSSARELDSYRASLFAPIKLFEEITSSFLVDKDVQVSDQGELTIKTRGRHRDIFELSQLSSGEKQILILLTQVLLTAEEPVVYVVDEPELSLHVTWQEKLLPSIVDLGSSIQIIAATHSPDIVGPFKDKIINLEKV